MHDAETSSTRPYLLRALHEWCTDNGLTPFIAVRADDTVQVPREYVKNGEIVLNISLDATSGLRLGNDFVEFKARFGGVPREIIIPTDRVMAIYARENGQGMAFTMEAAPATAPDAAPAPESSGKESGSKTGSGKSAAEPLAAGPAASAGQPAQPPARGGIQLVSSTPTSSAPDGQPPTPPARPGGKPPALKRIK